MINNIKCFMKLMKKKDKLLLLLVSLVLMIIICVLFYYREYSMTSIEDLRVLRNDGIEGIRFFYMLQDANYMIWLFLLITLIIPNLISDEFLKFRINHFDNFIINRMSYNRYFRDTVIFNMLITFIYIMIVDIVLLIVIHLFYFPISLSKLYSLSEPLQYGNIITNNAAINIVLYVIMSSFGYSLYSSFIYSLQTFIHNTYLYKACGVIISIILYLFPTIFSVIILNYTHMTFLSKLIYYLALPCLITPGIAYNVALNMNYLEFYIGALCLYFILIYIFMKVKRYTQYGNL